MKMIQTENITKKYKRYKKQEGVTGSIKGLFHREYEEKIAVDAFNMDVDEGEFIGLIGPNVPRYEQETGSLFRHLQLWRELYT